MFTVLDYRSVRERHCDIMPSLPSKAGLIRGAKHTKIMKNIFMCQCLPYVSIGSGVCNPIIAFIYRIVFIHLLGFSSSFQCGSLPSPSELFSYLPCRLAIAQYAMLLELGKAVKIIQSCLLGTCISLITAHA